MPTVVRIRGYRFFFFSNEGTEPPHIHVEAAEKYAKFWIRPVRLADNVGFNSSELSKLRLLVEESENKFEERWNEHFNT